MRNKKIVLTNFSRAASSESLCIRPDNEHQLAEYIRNEHPKNMLARGSGLSYSDSCLNKNELVIDTSRLNHFISFDENSGIVVCQAGITFKELLQLDANYISPVLPGTLHATLGGGIAHDVHGKNNHKEKSFGHHILWLDLLVGSQIIHCSRQENSALFYATIGGLGLTGIITRLGLQLKKGSRSVHVENKAFLSLHELTTHMSTSGLDNDYQVAWLDLLHDTPRALLSLANHCPSMREKINSPHCMPKIPFRLIKRWNMKLFNQYFFSHKKKQETLNLEEFNNPLDKITHWNYLYGNKGLIQFQAVFQQENAVNTMLHLFELIRTAKATPTLCVLKLFTQTGEGLLSFCKPGFTIAIDFIHNEHSRNAIKAMNQFITTIHDRIYLAKDLLLTAEQYQHMYPNHQQFKHILRAHHCTMNSDLAKRLGVLG